MKKKLAPNARKLKQTYLNINNNAQSEFDI